MISLRTHYLMNGVARCGNPLGQNWTVDPKQVTCGTCKRLMAKELRS